MPARAIVIVCLALAAGQGAAASAPCWIDHGAVVVSAAFGDVAGDFILDTAAPRSLLHDTVAQETGLTGDAASADLVLDGRRVAAVGMKVVSLDDRAGDFDASINGVIGADVLGRFDVELAFDPCRLTLRRPRARPPSGGRRLVVTRLDGLAAVEAIVSDGATVRAGLFVVDTGREPSLIPAAGLSRPATAGASIRLRALEVGGRLFEQIPASPTVTTTGAIGVGVWRRWRVMRLDVTNGWLTLGR